MPPAPPMPDMGGMPDMGDESEEGEEKKSPKEEVEESLTVMESEIDKVRKSLQSLTGGEDVNVNVNVGKEEEEGGSLKLSHSVARQLKTALAEMNESADELAMIAETYEGAGRLSSGNRRELDKIATASLREASSLIGQSTTLTKMARTLSVELTKVAKIAYAEDHSSMAYDSAEDYAADMMGYMSDDAADMMNHMSDDSDDDLADDSDHEDDSVNDLMSKAMDFRRIRREQIVVEAAKKSKKMDEKMEKLRASKQGDKKDEKPAKKKAFEEVEMSKSAGLRDMVNNAFQTKKAEDEKDSYKIRLRRAYDVAIEMQKKGLLPISKTALDKQVDDIMDFDDKAFEAFKRSVASARTVETIKIARDLGGVNVGVESTTDQPSSRSTAELLSMLWE
jgi:hypothetical protein